MSGLTIVAALVLDRLTGLHRDARIWRRFQSWLAWLKGRGLTGPGTWSGAALLVLPPVLLVLWLDHLVGGWLQALLTLAVLLFALGPRDLYAISEDYIQACRREDAARAEAGAAALGVAGGAAGAVGVPRALLRAALHQYFSPIFWLLLLGPAGALLVRSCSGWLFEPEAQPLREPLRRTLALLDWLPARLALLLFGICGNFDAAWRAWQPQAAGQSLYRSSLRQLEEVGLAAANAPAGGLRHGDPRVAAEATQAVRALLLRALVLVFVLALILGVVR